MAVDPIPEGFHTLTPYLIIEGADEAMEFYKKAFGAKEMMRSDMKSGKVGHAEMEIGNSRFMIADDFPDAGFVGVKAYKGSPVSLHLYVEDSDSAFNQAVSAGAEVVSKVETQVWGDRSGQVKDPFGFVWTLSTHVEDVPADVVAQKLQEMFGDM